MIGDLIAIVFLSRDLAHRAHLQTTSYAQHMALGDFYSEVVSKADGLAEAYMGRNGVIKDIPLMDPGTSKDITDALQEHLDAIEGLRYKAIKQDDTPLQNMVDDLCGLYLSTLYKLRRFK